MWAQVRARGQATSAKRAVYMGLCEAGTTGVGMLYSLGGARKYYAGWDGFAPAEKARMTKEILQVAEKHSG